MKLIPESTEQKNALLPVTWCLSEDERQQLVEKGGVDPYLLLVVTGPGRQHRELVPLDQRKKYIPVIGPGENTIHADVVWDKENVNLKESLLRKWDRNYRNDVFPRFVATPKSERKIKIVDSGIGQLHINHKTTVEVDEEFFADEPPVWEQKWVNLGFDSEPRDQCAYRRRRLFAYTAKPILAVVASPLALLVLIVAGVGSLVEMIGEWYENTFADDIRRRKLEQLRENEQIVCNNGEMPDVDQNLRLRYEKFKAKVCKPFAG